MESSYAFDTHAYVKELMAVGFTEQQAEIQTKKFNDLIEDKLATKKDLLDHDQTMKTMEVGLRRDMKEIEERLRRDMKAMEAAIRHDMKEMEASIRHDMKEMELRIMAEMGSFKVEILKWVAGMLLAQSAVIASLVKLL